MQKNGSENKFIYIWPEYKGMWFENEYLSEFKWFEKIDVIWSKQGTPHVLEGAATKRQI